MNGTPVFENRLGGDHEVVHSRAKRIVVTGASGAIGQAIVHEFCRGGHAVLGIDSRPFSGDVDIDEFVELDLAILARSPESERRRLLADVRSWAEEPGLNVLVNNAAVQVLGPLEQLDVDQWRDSLEVNLLAPFFLVKDLLSPLERGNGSVINISSIHARETKPGFVAYSTTKAALSGLTRAMAVELGPRVRVNAIEPASILTPMLEASFASETNDYEKLSQFHPRNRIGTPQEVASLVYAVALGDFPFLHGSCIDLSGGLSARLHDPG